MKLESFFSEPVTREFCSTRFTDHTLACVESFRAFERFVKDLVNRNVVNLVVVIGVESVESGFLELMQFMQERSDCLRVEADLLLGRVVRHIVEAFVGR